MVLDKTNLQLKVFSFVGYAKKGVQFRQACPTFHHLLQRPSEFCLLDTLLRHLGPKGNENNCKLQVISLQ